MYAALFRLLSFVLLSSLGAQHPGLLEAREGFSTKLLKTKRSEQQFRAPRSPFALVDYPTKLGPMKAYLSKPKEKGRSPAILWITGGDHPGGAGQSIWKRPDPDDDQTAQAYRHAGLVMMYPAFRGSFGNPGSREAYYGEVDDVLAALAYLEACDFVDPKRIYLGGHSSGGTLALLVATATDRFKAVFAFGPIGNPVDYGDELPFDKKNRDEVRLRAPIAHLRAIRVPTYAIEGTGGNYAALIQLKVATSSRKFKVIGVQRADHFDVMYPTNRLIAATIKDLAADEPVVLKGRAIQVAFDKQLVATRESYDLDSLSVARGEGVDFTVSQRVTFSVTLEDKSDLDGLIAAAKEKGFVPGKVWRGTKAVWNTALDPADLFRVPLSKRILLSDLKAVFAASAIIDELCRKHSGEYDWSVTTGR